MDTLPYYLNGYRLKFGMKKVDDRQVFTVKRRRGKCSKLGTRSND